MRTNISLEADPTPAAHDDLPNMMINRSNQILPNQTIPNPVKSPARKRGRGRPKKFTEEIAKVLISTEDDKSKTFYIPRSLK